VIALPEIIEIEGIDADAPDEYETRIAGLQDQVRSEMDSLVPDAPWKNWLYHRRHRTGQRLWVQQTGPT